jgi:hypothetical protein
LIEKIIINLLPKTSKTDAIDTPSDKSFLIDENCIITASYAEQVFNLFKVIK